MTIEKLFDIARLRQKQGILEGVGKIARYRTVRSNIVLRPIEDFKSNPKKGICVDVNCRKLAHAWHQVALGSCCHSTSRVIYRGNHWLGVC